jgi:hypothetical protein
MLFLLVACTSNPNVQSTEVIKVRELAPAVHGEYLHETLNTLEEISSVIIRGKVIEENISVSKVINAFVSDSDNGVIDYVASSIQVLEVYKGNIKPDDVIHIAHQKTFDMLRGFLTLPLEGLALHGEFIIFLQRDEIEGLPHNLVHVEQALYFPPPPEELQRQLAGGEFARIRGVSPSNRLILTTLDLERIARDNNITLEGEWVTP